MKEQSMEILIGKKIRDLSKKKQDELLKVIKPLTETKSLFFIYEEIINNIEHIMSNLAETFEKVGGLEKYYLERADKIKESG
ncbi:hypothetical protein NYK91_001917 [Enterococcus hirae]|nr:hypothetical protein [Enterococcus hirae]